MLRLKVLTFDVTNTLMKVRYTVGQQYAKVASQFSVKVNADDLDRAYRPIYMEQVRKRPNFGAETGITSEQWWAEVVHKSFQQVGVTEENTVAKISSKLYEDFKQASSWEVFPEVKEILTFLNKNGVCLGVISNMDERLITILQQTELAKHFALILPSVYAKCHKPDPEIFQQVIDRLQVSASDCAHIGDSIEKDYHGAKSAGMQAYVIDRTGTLRQNHTEIPQAEFLQDLTELENKIFLGETT